MENFILWLYNSFRSFVGALTSNTVDLINNTFLDFAEEKSLVNKDVNLSLFSETPILTMNAYDLLLLFFSVFYTVIFVVIIYKIIKKVLVKITGWKKW